METGKGIIDDKTCVLREGDHFFVGVVKQLLLRNGNGACG